MQRDYRVYLDDVADAIANIEEYTRDLDFDEFVENKMVRDAVIRNLEIIGEAVKNLPDEIKEKHPEIEWRDIAGLRDILSHKYFEVNLKILWDVIENKLPELKEEISGMI